MLGRPRHAAVSKHELCDDIREQRILDALDLVLELKFALFQPCQLKLVARAGTGHCRDRGVKIAVFFSQLRKLGP